MARLVVFDICIGRVVRMRGTLYTIVDIPRNTPAIFLQRGGDAKTQITMTRSELATLVVLEEAEFVDELEDPLRELRREVTNLSLLPVFRIYNWFTLMFMFRRMLYVSRFSPRSPEFRTAYARTMSSLKAYRLLSGIIGGRIYSPWTLYNCIRRWRASGYSLSSLQKRGFEYSPWLKRDPVLVEAERFATEYIKAHPDAAVADVHEETDKHLKEWTIRQTQETAL